MDYEGLENQSQNVVSQRIFLPLDIPFERFRRILCNKFDLAFRRIFVQHTQREAQDRFSVLSVVA